MYRLRNALRVPIVIVPLLLLALGGCSDTDPADPVDATPEITISGVTDGGIYEEPVVITVATSAGSYSAQLNGSLFVSGQTVAAAGSYTLVVQAQNGLATASRTVAFSIVEPGLDATTLLVIRMLDLGDNAAGGGGDAILLTDSSAAGLRHALIDAGPAGVNGSNESYVAQRLAALGVDTLLFAQLTHAHSDHFSGMDEVLEAVHVEQFIYSGQVRNLSFYQDVIETANQHAGEVVVPGAVLDIDLGLGTPHTNLQVVPALPDHLSDGNASADELNEGSLGTFLERAGFRMFFTGDGEVAANARWRQSFAALTSALDVLKAGHHGANNAIFDNGFSGTSAWLTHTDPAVILISANGRTHPRLNALGRMMGQTERVYCTNVHGEITIRVGANGAYAVAVQRNADSDCVAGSEATT